MADPTVIDAEVVDDEPGTDLELHTAASTTLFRTDDPVEVLTEATRVANALKDVVKSQGMIAVIQGREHPMVEAWQTLGSMLGVAAVPLGDVQVLPWPDPVPDSLKTVRDRGCEFGFVATYQAIKNGEVVGGGQSRCVRTESTWKGRDDFALASMAQTRAISKTLSSPLRFVMTLAGYAAAPAEEMPDQPAASVQAGPPFGPTADLDTDKAAKRALGALAAGNGALAAGVYQKIGRDCGGYFPAAAAHAVLRVAEIVIGPSVDAPAVN